MELHDEESSHHYHQQQQFESSNNLRLRISVSSHQGSRKYMEDEFVIIHYEPPTLTTTIKNGNDHQESNVFHKSFAFLGIFDGHGGDQAARYSRQNLCHNIVRQRKFWSDDDDQVCLAIHKGFVRTQKEMMREVEKWPRTTSGLPSTSGTTASVLFIMNGKYYTGHVGDSRIVLGRKLKNSTRWQACPMTRDHKPESPRELKRIEAAGGQVMNKSGIGRVVWNRPRRIIRSDDSTIQIVYDLIPFLSVARSLGDLWSLNRRLNRFIVSPEPDVKCIPMDMMTDKCLILASDGLWNMINHKRAIKVVQDFEEINVTAFDRQETNVDGHDDDDYVHHLIDSIMDHHNKRIIHDPGRSHSLELFAACIDRWMTARTDNTTVLVVMFDNNNITNQQQQGNHHNKQIFDQYEFDLNSDDSFGSSSSSESTMTTTTISPLSPSSLQSSMIGDTIHSFDCFDSQQTDEKYLGIKPEDEEEIESIVDQLLNRLTMFNTTTNTNNDNLPSKNHHYSELIDLEQMSSIQVTTITSDTDNDDKNNPIVSLTMNPIINAQSTNHLQQLMNSPQRLATNVYFRINFNYSFQINDFHRHHSLNNKLIVQSQTTTANNEVMANNNISKHMISSPISSNIITSSSPASPLLNDMMVVSKINLINSIENLSTSINRNGQNSCSSNQFNDNNNVESKTTTANSFKRKTSSISSPSSDNMKNNLLFDSSINNDHNHCSDNLVSIDLSIEIDDVNEQEDKLTTKRRRVQNNISNLENIKLPSTNVVNENRIQEEEEEKKKFILLTSHCHQVNQIEEEEEGKYEDLFIDHHHHRTSSSGHLIHHLNHHQPLIASTNE